MEDIVREMAIKWTMGRSKLYHQDTARWHQAAYIWKAQATVGRSFSGIVLGRNAPFCEQDSVLKTQPACSPDLNLNNNGFFNALRAGYKRHDPRDASDMIKAIFRVLREYPDQRINHMRLTWQTNFDEVIKIDSDNNEYKTKHMNKFHLERLGQLPTVIKVSVEARQHIKDNVDEDYELTPNKEEEMNVLEE
jgi:hypothetical protein